MNTQSWMSGGKGLALAGGATAAVVVAIILVFSARVAPPPQDTAGQEVVSAPSAPALQPSTTEAPQTDVPPSGADATVDAPEELVEQTVPVSDAPLSDVEEVATEAAQPAGAAPMPAQDDPSTDDLLEQMEALMAAHYRAIAFDRARELEEAERGRARLKSFLGD